VAHQTGDAYADSGLAALVATAGRYGVRLAVVQPFDPATTDFKPVLGAVRGSGAKLLLVWGSGSAPPLLERAWKGSGLGIPILLSTASCTTAFLRSLSDAGEVGVRQAERALARLRLLFVTLELPLQLFDRIVKVGTALLTLAIDRGE